MHNYALVCIIVGKCVLFLFPSVFAKDWVLHLIEIITIIIMHHVECSEPLGLSTILNAHCYYYCLWICCQLVVDFL